MKRITRTAAWLVLLAMALPAAALAQPRFIEDFDTSTYEENNTSHAHWDTVAGELRLWPFESSLRFLEDTPGNSARKVAIQGIYAYVADGNAGVQVMDISNPANPVLVANVNTPGYVNQVHPAGDWAYVADHNGGLQVINIQYPTLPVLAGSTSLPGNALGLDVVGDFAYVGTGAAGLVVVSIHNPAVPSVVGIHDTDGDSARSVEIAGDHAYVTDGNKGLLVVDVSDPTGPYADYQLSNLGDVQDLVVHGDRVFISANGHGLWVADISDPTQPVLAGSLAVDGVIRSLDLQGDRVFLANDSDGVQVIDISDPSQPTLRETIATPGHAYDVEVHGHYALAALFGPGLQSIEVGQVVAPALVGEANSVLAYPQVAVSGDLLYVAVDRSVQALDLSDPGNPVLVSSLYLSTFVRGAAISGDLLVVAGGTDGVILVDVSDPAAMDRLGEVVFSDWVESVAFHGDVVLVAARSVIGTVDISNPLAPTSSEKPSPITAYQVDVQGDRAYLSGWSSSTMAILDISDPNNLAILGTHLAADPIQGLKIRGDLAYLACATNGVEVVDVSEPFAPQLTGSWVDTGYVRAVEVIGEQLFVAQDDMIAVLDIRNPANPSWSGSSALTGREYAGLTAWGDFLIATPAFSSTPTGILRVLQHEVDLTRRFNQSLFIQTDGDPIQKIRLTAEYVGPINWGLAVDFGGVTHPFVEGLWLDADTPGQSLTWLAEMGYAPGVVTAIDELTLEWLYERPLIAVVSDVANDQGGQVRLEWVRSSHDFLGDETQITEYAIYREIAAGLTGKARTAPDLTGAGAALQMNVQTMKTGGWDYLTSVPVLIEDRYAVVVPTQADSTVSGGPNPTTFKVVGLTAVPGVFFESYPDSGSSVDNLAPNRPTGIAADYGANGVDLAWNEAPEADFHSFRVYRGESAEFVPGPGNLLQVVFASAFTDGTGAAWGYHYKITAVDLAGNESEVGQVTQVSDTPRSGPAFVLRGAVPNPFNPLTRIDFSLAVAGRTQLVIYDVAGRVVRTLVDEQLPAGDHGVRWDGRNQAGRQVASGAYFALLRSGDQVQRQRMLLMK